MTDRTLKNQYMKFPDKEILVEMLLLLIEMKTEMKITNQHLSGMRVDIAVMRAKG